jgi:RNA polymerase sigma factor (sigma-70 family)
VTIDSFFLLAVTSTRLAGYYVVTLSQDGALVARLRSGDTDALRDTYARFSEPIFRFLLRLAGRRDVAEDLYQETWLAAAKHATRLAEDTDLAAWLFTVARNKYRTWRRFTALDWSRIELFKKETAVHETTTGGDSRDTLEELDAALAELSPANREVLLLIAVEGLDSAQAAQVLGIHPDALRQRLSRARTLLAERLQIRQGTTRTTLVKGDLQ